MENKWLGYEVGDLKWGKVKDREEERIEEWDIVREVVNGVIGEGERRGFCIWSFLV